MTVAELIAALSIYPPDTSVVVDGYEGGFDHPVVRNIQVDWESHDPTRPYEGIHDPVTHDGLTYRDGDMRAPRNPRNVVVVSRRRLT